jgi:hypothetical protein
MSPDVRTPPLLAFLQHHSPEYAAKVTELRTEAAKWLSYTTASFTHYTAHTVDHSDEIIRQISNLLFRASDPAHPVVDLSTAEAFILCAAALLHDTGMVVSDADLRAVLESPEWLEWLNEQPSRRERRDEIASLRAGTEPPDEYVRHLVADREMKYLVLEYVRTFHHRRSAQFLTDHQPSLGRFAFDDPILIRSIAAVCLAHGLDAVELEDREQFPEQRDVLGEKVNVRFCAFLLRIGDLLDMSYDRACPLLANAASPLPAESIAHWSQYSRVTHRNTDPDRIELIAACETQDEHRYLHDWCNWLVQEIATARTVMARSARHSQWTPPEASLGEVGTIVIRPSATARYVAVDWQLELDQTAVLERLIHDVNTEPTAFIRELLQNAFDATRCEMYQRMSVEGVEPPPYPDEAGDVWLDRFPVSIVHTKTSRFSELSQKDEERDVVVVEDLGIGMDRETILKYLLQVGRSYYTSEDFARRYHFVPTSRFGVGFLSVFDAADEVRVETRREAQPANDALRLTLQGPRSYVLTERIDRVRHGTRIEIVLRKPLEQSVYDLVQRWCKRVEFPIIVSDERGTREVRRETPDAFCYVEPSALDADETMGVRSFPISAEGIKGEIYVFFIRTSAGETWTHHSWATYAYPTQHPDARAPRLPSSLVCLHGIATEDFEHARGEGVAMRLDYRRHVERLPMSRRGIPRDHGRQMGIDDPDVRSSFMKVVTTHVTDTGHASGPNGWIYKQRLITMTGLDPFWLAEPTTVRTWSAGKPKLDSIEEIAQWDQIDVVVNFKSFRPEGKEPPHPVPKITHPVLTDDDVNLLAADTRRHVFARRAITSARWINDEQLLVAWTHTKGDDPSRIAFGWGTSQLADIAPLPGTKISLRLHKAFNETYDHAILNADHEFVQWLISVQAAALADSPSVMPEQWLALTRLLESVIWYSGFKLEPLTRFLETWREAHTADLPPPATTLSQELFTADRPTIRLTTDL